MNQQKRSELQIYNRKAFYRRVVIFCVMLSISLWTGVAQTKAEPRGLPSYFALGLKNTSPNLSWMIGSGVPWNYRYQYLNVGWGNWNSPKGQFASNYIQGSLSNGYIPVFSWYEAGSQSYNPSMLFSNLSTPSFMNAYFASWKLMLQKAGAFSGTVIVHVEPDMWSFMQQQLSQDPTTITVSVASSGFSEVASFANNASGFAQALIGLRNTYAPNVLLAWDNSMWAVNYDPTCYSTCWSSAATYGSYVASFYQKLAAKFDLIFFNTSDSDSGYKVAVLGQPSAQAWWNDSAFDNFRRYVAAITQVTGLKGMLWQTPAGNTLYRTVNNTKGHYQDNRPQYFLQGGNRQHIIDYVVAGIIGMLFSSGPEYGVTSYWDVMNNGITNPPAIGGNTLSSIYSDDDGGFLRTSAAAYYSSGPVPVP